MGWWIWNLALPKDASAMAARIAETYNRQNRPLEHARRVHRLIAGTPTALAFEDAWAASGGKVDRKAASEPACTFKVGPFNMSLGMDILPEAIHARFN